MSRQRLAGVGAATLMLLTGCSSDNEPTPTATGTSVTPTDGATGTGSPTPSSAASATTGSQAGFSLDDKEGGDYPELGRDAGTGADVRVGTHTGYDRVVFDFDGPETPAYSVKYVDVPTGDASGDEVAVEGDAYLEVLVTSVGYPIDDQEPPVDLGPAELDRTVVAGVSPIFGGFEGIGQTFIGIRGEQRPFRVTVESSPTRLVVDIAR